MIPVDLVVIILEVFFLNTSDFIHLWSQQINVLFLPSSLADKSQIWQQLQHYSQFPNFNNYLVFILAQAEVFYLRLSLFSISVYLFHESLFKLAVANSTSATFLRVVGSELIQKYLGDGPKLVRELFRVADDISLSIVFIDEIDAVCTKR
ncbi:hypothetical protein F3Y22_tig00111506pilonHSYRG00193 [Hibiscus syriacus]|uniref:ATPase AAA-type core domain-containing protein n=1 Tax=Hibiscus syriacus TaxID=106335 RepID=A0A6A2XP53_HIBSY|nr:hypothetical protein F3Y22_tig00111506pilonHSYRG00193 [Hibiscus syriacus]